MKTKSYNSKNTETFDDIVFEHRNKKYGAYYIKKRSIRYLSVSFLISLIFVASVVAIPLIRGPKPVNQSETDITDREIVLSNVDHNDNFDYAPPPPPQTNKLVKQNAYIAPMVVDEVTSKEFMMTMDEIIDQTTNKPVNVELIPVVDPDPVIIEPDADEPVVFVEEPAQFQDGSLDSFRAWVMDRLQYPQIAIENQIEGRVFVQFCVDKKGQVVDIKITRGLDDSTNEEVLRVLNESPQWIPARQGGSLVKQLFSMSVVFDLKEN